MEAKGGSGAPGGRPKNFDGSEQAVLNIFTQHLGPRMRTCKKLNSHKLFVDLSRCKDKNKAARPFVELMHAMGTLNANFRFGGPFQIRVLLQWNRQSHFHPTHKSRPWATEEVGKLWLIQRHFEVAASTDEAWTELVQEVDRFPKPLACEVACAGDIMTDDEEDEDGDDEAKLNDLPSWMMQDIRAMTQPSGFSEDEAPEDQEEDQLVGAGESQQVCSADEAAGANKATQPDGGQHGKPCPFDVTMTNGMPTCTTDQGLVLYGSLMAYASEDGLSMAVFPGFSIPVEVPGLMFKQSARKRPAANAEGCVAKKPALHKADEGQDEAIDGDGGDGEDGDEDEDGEEEGAEEEECAEGDEADCVAEGDKAECEPHVKKKRPLQLWLQSRPSGMNIKDRHANWRSMSKEEKQAYMMSTKAERGL